MKGIVREQKDGSIMQKIAVSYSCGKDSVLALHRLKEEGYLIRKILVTVDQNTKKSFFHNVPEGLLKKIGESLGIEVQLIFSAGEDYRQKFLQTLLSLKEEGITACAFGDIDIGSHRNWCELLCEEAGVGSLFPLWEESREALVREVVELGYSCRLQKVNKAFFSVEILGRSLDIELLEDMKRRGIDVCGENGEYHTFVTEGPLFEKAIDFVAESIEETEDSFYLLLRDKKDKS